MKNFLSKIALLITLPLVITGCDNFLDGGASRRKATTGSFSLVIAEPNAGRTIMPSPFAQADIEGYYYTLSFTPAAPTENDTVTANRTYANLSSAVQLPVGIWDLIVTAYQDEARSQPTARGSLNEITIAENAVQDAVELKAITGDGTGKFRWSLTFTEDISAAMTITPRDVDGTPEETIDITPSSGNSIAGLRTLNAGYYDIAITVSKTQRKTVERRDVLHVYQNLESVLEFEFSDEYLNRNVHIITYQYNDQVTPDDLEPCDHGDAIVLPPQDPTRAGYEFAGWFTDEGLTAEYDGESVIGDMKLYAKWGGYTSVDNISEYLQDPSNVGTIENPLPLNVNMPLGNLALETSVWRDLLAALHSAGDYVNLDISECTIEGEAFNHNNSTMVNGMNLMREISLPSGITSIGENAFSFCTNLNLIKLPNGITSIGIFAFRGCTSLNLSALPNGITSISISAFHDCSNLNLTALPNSIISIGYYAFRGCTSLNLSALPNGITSIGGAAFWGCTSLSAISLPNSITFIGGQIFEGCTSLIEVTCNMENPLSVDLDINELGWGAFPSTTTIYVPSESLDDYKNAPGWSAYAGQMVGFVNAPSQVP